MTAPMFSACGCHQALLRMPFERALDIARECDQCDVEEACS